MKIIAFFIIINFDNCKKSSIFAPEITILGRDMHVYTDNEALKELIETGQPKDRRYRSLPKQAVRGFLKAYNILLMEQRIEGLFKYKGLNYERLTNSPYESVRCDGKYRLLFISRPEEGEIIITNIELIEITNHYGTL